MQGNIKGKFKVITLCGSSKFKKEFIEVAEKLSLEGNIVISLGLFGHADNKFATVITDDVKAMLDAAHKQKIEMSDAIYVINPGGYIGDSTRSEIGYAINLGKEVHFLEPIKSIQKIGDIYKVITDNDTLDSPGDPMNNDIITYKIDDFKYFDDLCSFYRNTPKEEVIDKNLLFRITASGGYDYRNKYIEEDDLIKPIIVDGLLTWIKIPLSFDGLSLSTSFKDLCETFNPHIHMAKFGKVYQIIKGGGKDYYGEPIMDGDYLTYHDTKKGVYAWSKLHSKLLEVIQNEQIK